jgi:hypothetical protein
MPTLNTSVSSGEGEPCANELETNKDRPSH